MYLSDSVKIIIIICKNLCIADIFTDSVILKCKSLNIVEFQADQLMVSVHALQKSEYIFKVNIDSITN